jgi:hypothetical protein
VSGVESFDDEHRCTTEFAPVNTTGHVLVVSAIVGRVRWYLQQFVRPSQVLGANFIGEQSIVTDAVKATGQDMQEKAPDEFVRGQGHGLVAITLWGAIVFPLEGDTPLITGDQTAVGDRHSMGVARQISEHGIRSSKGAFGIDDPVDIAHWADEAGERWRIAKCLVACEELQLSGVVGRAELFQEEPPE